MFKLNFFNVPKFFEKIFNRENVNEKNVEDMFKTICENCDIEKPEWGQVVGGPVKAYSKTIYPILEIVSVGNKMQNFKGVEIFPTAVVIEELGKKYAISLTGEEIDSDELIRMVSKK